MIRPGIVTFFSVINILISLWGLLVVFGTVMLLMIFHEVIPLPDEAKEEILAVPQISLLAENQGYLIYLYMYAGLILIETILYMAGAIGMIKLVEWSRVMTIGLGVFSMVFIALNYAVNYVLLSQPMAEFAEKQASDSMMGNAEWQTLAGVGAVVVALVYFASMVFVLTRASTVAAFAEDEDGYGELAEVADASDVDVQASS